MFAGADVMTAIASHLSAAELEARYETAADPVSKSHFTRFGYYPWAIPPVKWRRSYRSQRAGLGYWSSATTNKDRTAWATGGRATPRCPRSLRQKRLLP